MNERQKALLAELLESRAREVCPHCAAGVGVELNDLRNYAWHDNDVECCAYEELWIAARVREELPQEEVAVAA
jgi:hypothetical protein